MPASEAPAPGTVGDRVRAARVRRMWTQELLAEQSGIGRVTIARIETGKATPRMRTVRALAAALGVDHSTLVPNPEALWLPQNRPE